MCSTASRRGTPRPRRSERARARRRVLLGQDQASRAQRRPSARARASGRAGGSAPSRRTRGRSCPPAAPASPRRSSSRSARRSCPGPRARAGRSRRAARPPRAEPRRPVQLLDPVEVEARDVRAAPLELERPEPVEGADVEHALPGDVRQPVAVDEGTEVEHPLGHDPGAEVERVVPRSSARTRSRNVEGASSLLSPVVVGTPEPYVTRGHDHADDVPEPAREGPRGLQGLLRGARLPVQPPLLRRPGPRA